MTTKATDADSPAAAATRARCRPVKVEIGTRETTLGPVITPAGQLNSLTDASPPTPGGGYVLIVMEPIHGNDCRVVTRRGPCSCGAQHAFERLILQ